MIAEATTPHLFLSVTSFAKKPLVNRFDILRELFRLHQRGIFQTISERMPQFGKPGLIVGECGGEFGLLFGAVGDAVG
jgi:hypothetical protein